MRKNKGFTLIELLAVIIILGIVVTLTSMGVSKYLKTSKEKIKVQAAEEIIEIAKAYMATNNVTKVKVGDLISEGYLEEDATNPKTGKNDLDSSNNFYIIECTNCTKENKVLDDGYSDKKIYLSINDDNNEILSNDKVTKIDDKSENNSNFCALISESTKILWAKEAIDYMNEEKSDTNFIKVSAITGKVFINPTNCSIIDNNNNSPVIRLDDSTKEIILPQNKVENVKGDGCYPTYDYKYNFNKYFYCFNISN